MQNRRELKPILVESRTFVLLVLLIFCFADVYAGRADQIYDQGISAYQSNDYVTTVKKLYAYLQLNHESIHDQSKREIRDLIDFAEGELRVAILTKAELDKHGYVTEVVVVSEGKFDGGTTKKSTERFNAPPYIRQNKPRLPNIKKISGRPKPENRHRASRVKPTRTVDPPRRVQPRIDGLEQKYQKLIRKNKKFTQKCSAKLNALSDETNACRNSLHRCRNRL